MPRRLAAQVPQTISRLVQGGYIKHFPPVFVALTETPPLEVPARSPYQRSTEDLPQPSSSHISAANCRRANTLKKVRTRTPSLKPKPIVYLEDKVRQQFYRDHPWEGFRPRILVEHQTIQEAKVAPPEVAELTWWSTNPGPEE